MKKLNLSEFIKGSVGKDNPLQPPKIIAEAGVNHEGSIDMAKLLVDQAAEGGADAIKFQTYKAETLASKDSPPYWDTKLMQETTESQFKLFQKYDKFWKKEFEIIKLHCDSVGIEFLSTPFDIESANFLNDMMNVFKISSSDITNKPFIEFLCSFNKPIILSTGASNLDEIKRAVSWIESKQVDLALLHCVLNYPTKDENSNLGMILDLKSKFPNIIIGYSDHTVAKEMQVSHTAMLLGAKIIEKHFTHDKTLPGNDHYHAMDKSDLLAFKSMIDKTFTLIGALEKKSLPDEKISRLNARRSLVSKANISKGSMIQESFLTWKRPSHGIAPYEIDKLLGKVAKVDIPEDTVLKWDMFKDK